MALHEPAIGPVAQALPEGHTSLRPRHRAAPSRHCTKQLTTNALVAVGQCLVGISGFCRGSSGPGLSPTSGRCAVRGEPMGVLLSEGPANVRAFRVVSRVSLSPPMGVRT